MVPDNTSQGAADSQLGSSDSAKVVHLESDSQRILRSQLARLPVPVKTVHENGKRILLDLLKVYFDRADDSLFALADRAQNNVDQNLYFDSMREVRVQRRIVEGRFSLAIDEAFANLIVEKPAVKEEDNSYENISADSLSLVSDTDLDEIVAVEATVTKANKLFGELIQHLSLRMDSLVPTKVYQQNNPFGPDVICQAFMAQAKKLNVGVKAKLVLFKLFDRDVINKLKPLYQEANKILIEHNILPSLSTQVRRRPSAPYPSAPQSGGPHSNSPQSQTTTNAHASSGGVVNNGSGGYGGHANGNFVNANNANTNSDVALSGTFMPASDNTHDVNEKVVDALKHILGEQTIAPAQERGPVIEQSAPLLKLLSRAQHMPLMLSNKKVAINVRALLAQLQQQMGGKASVGRVDDEVMNLVNLLFDFILEDRNLSVPMKALISRMQIPILKVAIADKSFFTKGGHVARRLLNEMATASIGWQGTIETCEKDPLYKKIDSIVRRLLDEFDTDVSIFHELLADFTQFLEKEKKRAAVLERRIVDAEDGKAKAEIARQTIAKEIKACIKGRTLPEVVHHLVHEAWSNVLFVTALKHGYESKEWKSALQTMRELVASVHPPQTPEQRQKLITLVPILLKKLRTGLDTISYNPFEMSDLFKSLEKIHLACIRGKAAPAPSKPETPKTPEAAAPETKAVAPATEAKAPVEEKKPTGELELLPADDPHMEQVSRFVQGSWFDMKNANGENLRCRLATFIRATGKFIFVNRNGMKVAERTQNDLAHALKLGSLRVLDNSMLFDRALETVVTSLRKS